MALTVALMATAAILEPITPAEPLAEHLGAFALMFWLMSHVAFTIWRDVIEPKLRRRYNVAGRPRNAPF